MPILFALIAFLGWGMGDIFGGISSRKIGGYSSTFLQYGLNFILASLYAPFALAQLQHFTIETAAWLIFLLPIGLIPVITLYEGIKVGNASLVGTIGASFGAFVVVLSIIFLGEKINVYQMMAIITIFVGLILSSLNFKKIQVKELLSDKGIPYALISLLTWGIYFTFVKIPIRQIGWFWPAYISWAGFPFMLLYMKIRNIKLNLPKKRKISIVLLISVVLSTLALFAYNFALMHAQTAIVTPIASAYPVLFVVLAYFIFKDRLSRQQIIGIAITLLGIVSLSLF